MRRRARGFVTVVTSRPVAGVVHALTTVEGAGFVVHRPFPTQRLDLLDPFLLLDEMGPVELAPGEARGAPDHPHRGFETVTYMLEGSMVHRDSAGHEGVIVPGGVQWMTAGAGVVHSELPSEGLLRGGGRMHGVQLWVNLPAADKMLPPRYQGLEPDDIPVLERTDGARIRVIAGVHDGTCGPVETHSPITYLHVTLPAGAVLTVDAPEARTAAAYIIGESGRFGPDRRSAEHGDVVMFGRGGDSVEVGGPVEGVAGADARPLDALVLVAEPLREPVARYGPFVMNTREQISQAFEDYQAGRMGTIG